MSIAYFTATRETASMFSSVYVGAVELKSTLRSRLKLIIILIPEQYFQFLWENAAKLYRVLSKTYTLFTSGLKTELFCIPMAYFNEKKVLGSIDTLQLFRIDISFELVTSLM